MPIKQIQFRHPHLGEIIVHSQLTKEIEDVLQNGAKWNISYSFKYYHATDIKKNQDGTFSISSLQLVHPKQIWGKELINQIAGDDIIIYPSAVLSVIITAVKESEYKSQVKLYQ